MLTESMTDPSQMCFFGCILKIPILGFWPPLDPHIRNPERFVVWTILTPAAFPMAAGLLQLYHPFLLPKDGSLRHAALACVQQLHSANLTLPSEHSKCQQTPPPSLSKCPLSLAPSSIPFHSKGFVQTFKLGKGRWSLLKEKHSGLQESARPMRAFLP